MSTEKPAKKKPTKKKPGAKRKTKKKVVRKQYSDAVKKKAVKMYRENYSLEEIGKACKLSHASIIYTWLDDAGVKRRAPNAGPQKSKKRSKKKPKAKKAKRKTTRTRSKARRKQGDPPLTEREVNPKHARAAERVFNNAQREFRKLIGECARDDDFQGVDFFNQFAAQTADVRKNLAA